MCAHEHICDDEHTGDRICTECGTVVGAVFTEAPPASGERMTSSTGRGGGSPGAVSGSPPSPTQTASTPTSLPTAELLKARETVANVCANLYLDSTVIVDTVLHIFLQTNCLKLDYENRPEHEEMERIAISLELPDYQTRYWPHSQRLNSPSWRVPVLEQRPERDIINMTSVAHRAKLAFAILEALAREGSPRSPAEIATYLDVLPRHILAVENHCCTPTTYSAPSQYVERAVAFLDLPFYVGMLAQNLCKCVEEDFYGYRPEGLVAASIWLIVGKIRMKEHSPHMFGADLNLRMICNTLGISYSTADNCYGKLPKLIQLRRRFWPDDMTREQAREIGYVDDLVAKRCPYVLWDRYP